ncbi:MAG: contractile injection system protein, VgrG/Pvc8 family [Proteobacteria bacterium]|nr:contractile injection system protein, VgrG/Pvc8 family [Pseudomonadota bacterium]
MFQPDHATIELSNQADVHSSHKIGDAVVISVRDGVKVFEGEITAIKGIYKGDGHTSVLIHALNKLSRLSRARKSVTYQQMSDKDILSKVVSAAGLSLEWKHDSNIKYQHVYQHNQTDLEFLRTRAARLGCHVWCVGDKVMVKQPDFGAKLGIKLVTDKAGVGEPIRLFSPIIDSAGVVKKVTVRGWDPEKKQEIVGTASIATSPLGSKNASAASGPLGKEETFVVDHPIWSVEEANALAKAHLMDLTLKYITGECEISGNEKVDIGKTVEIIVSSTNASVPFNGNYYVMGLRHVHRVEKNKAAKSGDGGFTTLLRLARDGQEA